MNSEYMYIYKHSHKEKILVIIGIILYIMNSMKGNGEIKSIDQDYQKQSEKKQQENKIVTFKEIITNLFFTTGKTTISLQSSEKQRTIEREEEKEI